MAAKMKLSHKLLSIVLCAAMLMAYLPVPASSATAGITRVTDPATLTRPETIYGDNTRNAGKVTVGKSVSTDDVTVNGKTVTLDGENDFLVTISQSAQVMGMASQSNVPVDVVFVLDTSGSMDDNDRAETMVTAANSAIATLMESNEQNRVAVVAFSSKNFGGGTSNNAAANVLSSLAHYSGDSATSHLQWVNSEGSASGNDRNYIAGRDTVTVTTGNGNNQQTKTVNAYRNGKYGGTNIQAGIIEGAKILTSVTSTTYTDPDSGETVNRIPFLVILSDGQPTYSYDDPTWYNPTTANEQGNGNDPYEGNGFIAAMTAAYYKGLITEHYYGDKASSENRCYVYTLGVEIDSLSGDDKNLAQITLDPKSLTAGDYAAENAASYWNYGNTANNDTKNAYYGWKSYWNQYQTDPAEAFGVRVNGGDGVYIWTGDGAAQEYYEVEEPEEVEVPRKPKEPEEPNSWAPQWQWDRYERQLEQYERELAAYEQAMLTYDQDVAAYEQAMEEYEDWLQWREENFTYVAGQHYTFTAESITASEKYVNGVGYTGGIAYNDRYFNASSVSQMEEIFKSLITTIQQKAISVPTKVTSGDHDFDGYVTFYDPIGEYMEVKDMKGIVADGYFYQGATFAEKLSYYGTDKADAEFDALLRKVLKVRMGLSDADSRFDSEAELDAFIDELLKAAQRSSNQANYSEDAYDNSIVWWGNAYDSGEEDEHVQMVGFADNDTIAYIEGAKAADAQQTDPSKKIIPEGADYVCRSYFFYGEAGGTNPNPDHEYLYFMVRVQRELEAPYRETVVISAPASLLSMEKVFITESVDENGDPVYTADVEHQAPARVVYEVGLWDTINAENVSSIVSAEYASESVNGDGSVNYDAQNDTYNFFTNDWDRTQSLDSHHRGMAKATFDAAADNEFYTYQQDTLIVDAYGNAVTSDPAGTTAYYVREYYAWTSDGGADGTYTATKETERIEVDIPADAQLLQKDGKWYIPAGTYTAATLVVNGDDTEKIDSATGEPANITGTSAVAAHPHRTGDSSNSHYTVYLGNNGMLSLQADTYEPKKTVSVNLPASATQIVDDEGNPVKVGDVLTYTVEVKNVLAEAADITVTDYVPLGTIFVAGSAGSGDKAVGHTKDVSIAPDSNNVLTWVLEDVPAGATRYVSFQVAVAKAALSLAVVPGSMTNTAQFRINNGANISSNTTSTPVYGKTVTDGNNQDVDGSHGLKVGDTLVYHIRFHNNATDADGNYVTANVQVTDEIPQGTTFLSADNNGSYDSSTGVITWNFDSMAANTSQVVSFQVQINASAEATNGEIYLPNTANVKVNNTVIPTNTTENWADVGNMVISKQVAQGGDTSKTFTIQLAETSGLLDGDYVLLRGTNQETVTFVAGKASVSIKHGETLTIQGLPAGVIINVAEDVSALPGWTPTYNTQSVTIVAGAATAVSSVSVINTYTLQPLTVTVKGQKTLQGTALSRPATFGFVVQPDSGNPVVGDPLTGEVTVQNTGTYNFTMSPKVFTQPGTYKYTVYEINGGLLGITYDDTQMELVITVADNGDGTMRASATLNGAAFALTNDAVSFTNSYAPEETRLELTADKELAGRALVAGEFSFQAQLVEKDGNAVSGGAVYKGVNAADGKVVFESITYTEAGTYTYTLSEAVPANKEQGVTYDNTPHTVVVVVADNAGQYAVTSVTVDNTAVSVTDNTANTGITFRNSFEPDDVPLTLIAKKSLKTYDPATGAYVDAAPEAGKFRFQIVEKGTTNVVTTGSNAADGTITFNTFYFSVDLLNDVAAENGVKTRTFTYVISEVEPSLAKDPNMLYDLNGKEIEVTLTYTSSGELSVSVGGDSDGTVDLTNSVAFVNYSNPNSVEIRPVGTKTTTNAPSNDISFSFSVVNTESGNEAAVGVGKANGDISFSTMSFSQPDTYTYWIMESNAGNTTNGITYDPARYLMKVEVSRNEYNRLVANVTYWSSNTVGSTNVADYTVSVSAPSFRNEYNAGGYINLTAKKSLTGRNLNAGEFAFKLIRQDNGGEIDGLAAADGTITFSTMYYTRNDIPAGEASAVIHYVMSEVIPTNAALPGVTYDTSAHDVYVRITDEGNGKIKAELVKPESDGYVAITGTDTGVVFNNVYAPVHGDTVTFRIRKTLNGRAIREGEFDFLLMTTGGDTVDIATNDANGIVTFSRTIPPTAVPDTYTFVIKEAAGSLGGVTYDTTAYTIRILVTDDGKGNITAQLVDAEGNPLPETEGVVDLTGTVNFVNTYRAHETSYTPAATKTLSGRTLLPGEFSFQTQLISKDGAAVNNGSVYSGVNAANGNVVFENIRYTEAGTYIYTVKEVAGSNSGVRYDDTVFYLKVEVTDDGNGYLNAAAGYYSDAACSTASTAVFENTYTPADAEVKLEASKKLTGRDMNEKEFSFVVRENNETGRIVATGSNDAAGKILFSTFDLTATDMGGATSKTFTYVVMESDNNIPGVKVDTTKYIVTVTVTDDGNGHLAAQVNYPNNQPIVFKNTYKPAATELPLVAFKTLSGKNLKNGEFTFVLKEKSSGKVLQTVSNDGSGMINFNNLKFEKADTYVYTLTEVTGTNPLFGYDETEYTITVEVKDDLKGNLIASATYKNEDGAVELLQFANSYTPAAINAELEGRKSIVDPDGKVLTGANYDLSGFTFEVRDAEGNPVTTADSDAQGKIAFTELTLSAAGEYRFLISEKATNRPGYSIDTTIWCVHITVEYDANTGLLTKTGEYIHVAPESHEEAMAIASQELSFVNVYDPADVSLTLKVQKDLNGRALRDHEFTFYMVDKATGLRAAESRNHSDGTVPFHLTFTKAGNYTYVISEVDEQKLGGVGYSTEKYEIGVIVTDDGSGALQAKVGGVTVLGAGNVDMTDSVIFHNTYTAKSVDVTVEAVKLLSGKDLKAGAYTFALVNTTDSTEKYTATNTAEGLVKFDTITFTKAGEYVYTLSEVAGAEKGVTYDTHTYTVTVKVTDDGNGQLHAVTHYTSSDGGTEANPVFHNVYEAAPVDYTPQVKKIYEGGDMGTFDFVLTGEGFETQTKQNNQDGYVTFDKLTFDHVGTYTFTIQEKADPSIDEIRWDTNVYTMSIKVVDDGSGQLKIGDISITSENGRGDLVFLNVHEDLITKKDVFLNDGSASVDGKSVEKGDVLTYTVSYKNYTGKTIDITITDTIPANTAYVSGSADNGGIYANGVVTWNLTGIAPNATVTVSFNVKVTGTGTSIQNQAVVTEGTNTYETNTVTNTVKEDTFTKVVVLAGTPTVSVDGKPVENGEILLYKLTYTNADDAAAVVTITDAIPKYTTYVEASADNGGVYADGKLTWTLQLAAGESKTVTFRVKVNENGVTVENQAAAQEGGNKLETNSVKTTVPAIELPETGDNVTLHLWLALMVISCAAVVGMVFGTRKKAEDNQ